MHAVADHLQKTDQKSAGDTHITRINFMHILKLLQMNLDDETEIHATKWVMNSHVMSYCRGSQIHCGLDSGKKAQSEVR